MCTSIYNPKVVNMVKVYITVITFLLTCGYSDERYTNIRAVPTFQQGTIVGHANSSQLIEASGLAASRKHPGYLYTHNDHGSGPQIYVISASNGNVATTLNIKGATSHDWEDIAVGPCSNGSSTTCIYLADTGDSIPGAVNNIYRITEPADITKHQNITVTRANTIQFSWAETDCETLMVDPEANLYIVSKVDYDDAQGLIAKLPSDNWGTGVRVTVNSTSRLPFKSHRRDPVGGDISLDGNGVLIKAKEQVLYWDANGSRDYVNLLTSPGTPLPYTQETRGEAVCWDAKGHSYFTLGEGLNQPLYHYVRGSVAVGR